MGKTQKAQKKTTRVLLENPCKFSCPVVSDGVEEVILSHLRGVAELSREGSNSFRKELVFGLNAVSRCVENSCLCAVLVSRPVQPKILCEHLSVLCTQRGLPLVSHSQLNSTVAKAFGLTSLLALGLRQSAKCPTSLLHDLYKELVKIGNSRRGQVVPATEALGDSHLDFVVPKVDFPRLPSASQTMQVKDLGEQAFISLNQHPVFADMDYPQELETLTIRVHWTMEDLVRTQSSSESRGGGKYLVEAKTETLTSSGKVKKKTKSNALH